MTLEEEEEDKRIKELIISRISEEWLDKYGKKKFIYDVQLINMCASGHPKYQYHIDIIFEITKFKNINHEIPLVRLYNKLDFEDGKFQFEFNPNTRPETLGENDYFQEWHLNAPHWRSTTSLKSITDLFVVIWMDSDMYEVEDRGLFDDIKYGGMTYEEMEEEKGLDNDINF